jgi:hypothetical protein
MRCSAFVVVFSLLFPSLLAAAENVKPEDVRITEVLDEVEFCSALGEVKAKSGWGGSMGAAKGIESVKATLRKRAAAMGANVRLLETLSADFATSGSGQAYDCSADALAQQEKKLAELERKATAAITCTAGTDCEVRWSRVTLWLQNHSEWKFRNVTDTLITTEGPLETEGKPAFEVTKVPTGDGKTYRIAMRGFCGKGDCSRMILKLKASFYDDLTAPVEAPPSGS